MNPVWHSLQTRDPSSLALSSTFGDKAAPGPLRQFTPMIATKMHPILMITGETGKRRQADPSSHSMKVLQALLGHDCESSLARGMILPSRCPSACLEPVSIDARLAHRQGSTAPSKPPGAEPFAPAGLRPSAGRGLPPRFRAPFKLRRGRSPLQNFF